MVWLDNTVSWDTSPGYSRYQQNTEHTPEHERNITQTTLKQNLKYIKLWQVNRIPASDWLSLLVLGSDWLITWTTCHPSIKTPAFDPCYWSRCDWSWYCESDWVIILGNNIGMCVITILMMKVNTWRKSMMMRVRICSSCSNPWCQVTVVWSCYHSSDAQYESGTLPNGGVKQADVVLLNFPFLIWLLMRS